MADPSRLPSEHKVTKVSGMLYISTVIVHMSSYITTSERRPPRGGARHALLMATLEVIAAHGVDAVTHRRVAEAAGVSPGSATYHFTSRLDLIRSAMAYWMDLGEQVIARLDNEMRASTAGPKARVREVLCGVVSEAFEFERFVRAEYEMILFAATDEKLAADLRLREERWVRVLASDLEEAGGVRPLEIAKILINMTRGFDLERLANPELGMDELRRRLDLILTSLLPD